MSLDEQLATECSNWIAEQISEETGNFTPAELIDLLIEHESSIRTEHDDPGMDHQNMARLVLVSLSEEGVPISPEGVTLEMVEDILRWEDEFLGIAGKARTIRS